MGALEVMCCLVEIGPTDIITCKIPDEALGLEVAELPISVQLVSFFLLEWRIIIEGKTEQETREGVR